MINIQLLYKSAAVWRRLVGVYTARGARRVAAELRAWPAAPIAIAARPPRLHSDPSIEEILQTLPTWC